MKQKTENSRKCDIMLCLIVQPHRQFITNGYSTLSQLLTFYVIAAIEQTLLMTWVDITKSKYRHVSMQVEQRTSTRRNYRSTVIWATNHAQCLMTPA